MKKNLFVWIGIILIIVGAILSAFTDIANDIPGLAASAFGLGALIVSVYQKSEQKGVKVLFAIICIVLGAIACAIAGLSQEVTLQIITGVIGLVLLLIGILSVFVTKKKIE